MALAEEWVLIAVEPRKEGLAWTRDLMINRWHCEV